MIQIEETVFRKLILHRVSNEDSKVVINDSLFDYEDEDEEAVLKKIFLKPFVTNFQTFEFNHEIGLEYNVLFNLVRNVYEGSDFVEQSQNIAQHILSTSKHPNIKDGDLYVVKFDDIKLNNTFYEGVGIYKFEDKDSFIETSISNNKINYSFRKGIGSKKPDKACLILLTEEPYTILVIDNNNSDTDYWQNEFIKLKAKNDYVNNTNNFLTIAKDYITKQYSQEFQVSKADQIDLLNRSVEYFKTRDSFDKGEFEKEVLQHNNVINSFQNFDTSYRQENKIELSDSFEISAQAVKKQARVFKSVLKLDRNFHIYIHGNRELIEQGVDKDGRKFYKIYYEEEL